MKEIIVLGAGGHCRSIIDVIELENRFKVTGIIDNELPVGSKVLNYEVIGNDSDLEKLRRKYEYAIIGVGQIKTSKVRIKLFELLKRYKYTLPVIISPRAHVSKYAKIGEGSIIMHDVVVNTNANIGINCIINTKALIEHDARIGNHCHISTGAIINGECEVVDSVFVGSNTVVTNNIKIGSEIVIGSGSVVVNDILEKGVYAGNPARRIK